MKTYDEIERGLDGVRSDEERDIMAAFVEALLPLARYGRLMLDLQRKYLSDIDGGDAQDLAERCGLLAYVEATEACGENCWCAEEIGFPTECLRLTVAANALAEVDAARHSREPQ